MVEPDKSRGAGRSQVSPPGGAIQTPNLKVAFTVSELRETSDFFLGLKCGRSGGAHAKDKLVANSCFICTAVCGWQKINRFVGACTTPGAAKRSNQHPQSAVRTQLPRRLHLPAECIQDLRNLVLQTSGQQLHCLFIAKVKTGRRTSLDSRRGWVHIRVLISSSLCTKLLSEATCGRGSSVLLFVQTYEVGNSTLRFKGRPWF